MRESESDADWQDYPVVQQAQNNSRIDPTQNFAHAHPYLKHRSENLGNDQTCQGQDRRDHQSPQPHTLPAIDCGPQSNDAETSGHYEPKGPELGFAYLLFKFLNHRCLSN